jgi:hypothetical protein
MNTQTFGRREWPPGTYQTPLIATRALPTVPFKGAGHLANHGRYLFSQTDTHPENSRTHLNTIATFDAAGEIDRLQSNTTPSVAAKAWQDKTAGQEHLATSLRMDLHYTVFLYPSEEERVFYSNFIEGQVFGDRNGLEIDDAGLAIVAHDIGSDDPRALEHTIASHLAVGDRVLPWEQAPEEVRLEIFWRAFRSIQRKDKRERGHELVRQAEAQHGGRLPKGETTAILDRAQAPRCVLAVSHADQEAIFHIHRVFKA